MQYQLLLTGFSYTQDKIVSAGKSEWAVVNGEW